MNAAISHWDQSHTVNQNSIELFKALLQENLDHKKKPS